MPSPSLCPHPLSLCPSLRAHSPFPCPSLCPRPLSLCPSLCTHPLSLCPSLCPLSLSLSLSPTPSARSLMRTHLQRLQLLRRRLLRLVEPPLRLKRRPQRLHSLLLLFLPALLYALSPSSSSSSSMSSVPLPLPPLPSLCAASLFLLLLLYALGPSSSSSSSFSMRCVLLARSLQLSTAAASAPPRLLSAFFSASFRGPDELRARRIRLAKMRKTMRTCAARSIRRLHAHTLSSTAEHEDAAGRSALKQHWAKPVGI